MLIDIGAVLVAFVAGICVQHRWPVGRWTYEFTTRPRVAECSVASISQLPQGQRRVMLCIGQSNAANYGKTRQSADPRVFVLYQGKLFNAVDPLPGGDGYGGSIWTRLGNRLVASGKYKAVIFAVAARGSSYAQDWAPGGKYHDILVNRLADLRRSNLSVEDILWIQGEEESREPLASCDAYRDRITDVANTCWKLFPRARFYVAESTLDGESQAEIKHAQHLAAMQPGFMRGPDLDTLGSDYRTDGIHFNVRGLDAAADLWFATLSTPSSDRGS